MFVFNTPAPTRVKHLSGAPIQVRLLPSPTTLDYAGKAIQSLFTNFSKLQTLKVLQHLPLINNGFTTSEMTLPFTGLKQVHFVKYFCWILYAKHPIFRIILFYFKP
jgi:hypothetical protein